MNGFEIESDQMDEYYEYLGEQGIDLVGDNDNDEGPNNRQIAKSEEEFDLNDLSVPPGVKINDPVRMYLKEIGRVDLLSAEEEIDLQRVLKKAMKKRNVVLQKQTYVL